MPGRLIAKNLQIALKRLERPGAFLRPDPRGGFCVSLAADARRRPIARLSAADTKAMQSEGLIEATCETDIWRISTVGRSCLNRQENLDASKEPGIEARADFAPASPALRRLRALAAVDGSRWFSAAELRAAELFERDCRLALLSTRVTADWSASPMARGRRTAPGASFGPESAVEARARQARIRSACGPSVIDLLTDVFGEELGFEEIERRRAWPARSVKVGLKLALSAAAGAYAQMRSDARAA